MLAKRPQTGRDPKDHSTVSDVAICQEDLIKPN